MSAIREVALEKEVGELQAEVERLRDVIEATVQTLNAIGWPDAAKDLRRAVLRGGGK